MEEANQFDLLQEHLNLQNAKSISSIEERPRKNDDNGIKQKCKTCDKEFVANFSFDVLCEECVCLQKSRDANPDQDTNDHEKDPQNTTESMKLGQKETQDISSSSSDTLPLQSLNTSSGSEIQKLSDLNDLQEFDLNKKIQKQNDLLSNLKTFYPGSPG